MSWDGWSGRRLLDQLAPDAAAVFGALCSTVPVSRSVAATVRSVCADTLGIAGLPSGSDQPSDVEVDAAIGTMARQFATDVSAVDDSLRDRFTRAAGRSTFETVQAIFIADLAPRVMVTLDALAGAGAPWIDSAPVEVDGATFWASVEQFLRVVHRLDVIDPVLSEVIRLRGARQHNCRLCKSIRSRPALAAGANEELFDAIDAIDGVGWAGLPERTRIALALTDAMIWHPGSIPDVLVADVRRDFAPTEAVEVVLDVMHNAANKIAVALAADAPNVTEGLEVYEIDLDGVAHYGLAAP
jgi:alkylhydroperoxidase family enzyme